MIPQGWTKIDYSSRNALFAALVLIGAIAGYNWIVAPHRKYLLASEQRESVTQELLKKNAVVRKNLKTKESELEQLQEQFGQVRNRFFDTAGSRDFFSDIKVLAKEARCNLASLSFVPPGSRSKGAPGEKASDLTVSAATLNVVGGYRSILDFMKRLQDRPEHVQIDSISLGFIDAKPGLLKCEITVSVYVIQDKEISPHG